MIGVGNMDTVVTSVAHTILVFIVLCRIVRCGTVVVLIRDEISIRVNEM